MYNAEKFVEQALECLQRQTYKDLEIIISDNCSTDGTLEIVQRYAEEDSRIKIYQQDKNLGPLPNFQFVVSQSTGSLFMWRSYDDWSDDNYVEKLASVLSANPDVDLAVAKVLRWNDEREIEGGKTIPAHSPSHSLGKSIQLLKSSHPGWMYGLFRRQQAVDAINGVIRDFPHVWGWDHLVLFPFASQNRVAADYSTRFFQRETGISHDRYRPKLPKQQIALAASFYRYCRKSYGSSDASIFNKIAMAFYLLPYTSSRTEKFTRILRILLKLRRP